MYNCLVHTEGDDLKAIFKEHAVDGLLAVYLPRTPTDCLRLDCQVVQTAKSVIANGRNVTSKLATLELNFSPLKIIQSTDPVIASHLALFSTASLRPIHSSVTEKGRWAFHVLEKPAFTFSPLTVFPTFFPASNGVLDGKKGNVPTLEEWRNLWFAWDFVTLRMIPPEMLHQKPIDLRHKCLFYIGHIPTFLDMLLSKAIGGGPSEPKHFWNIFERGIDPHVDDPDHCHRHSEVPKNEEDWPALETILGFRDRVRARLIKLYNELETGRRPLTRNLARTLVMTLEHEGFHIETILYMLIQRAGTGTLPPPEFSVPSWELLAHQWANLPTPSEPTVVLGPEAVILGHDDCEADDDMEEMRFAVRGHTFGWDNESPSRKVNVGRFRVEWRPITNREFESFWRENKNIQLPKSWCLVDGEVKVRTIYGPISMEIARDWPMMTSFDDLNLYARSKGGRLPTEPELRLFLDKYDTGYEGGANVGFRHWHVTPATTGLEEYGGRGSNGGIWEWTSTLFDTHEGFSPTNLFTGYSTDFFDTKHHVVLGASYATIPRLAGRRTLRNFYQHNYPFAWVGARVVYDE
ncbi:hypothetical protein AX15_003254 [Amanita polypyramis BW_CC]|nr:hypothetical protein AX15_003254 [Amanita polypyramis BW_CC]